MKIKYSWIISFGLMLFISMGIMTNAHAEIVKTVQDSMSTYKASSNYSVSNNILVVFRHNDTYGDSISYLSSSAPITITYESFNGSVLNMSYTSTGQIYDDYTEYDLTGTKTYHRYGVASNISGICASYQVAVMSGIVKYASATVGDDSSLVSLDSILNPVSSSDFDISDIVQYPVGTVKIVQPQSGAKFSSDVSTTIDIEVWGKIPISIDDSSWFGLGEETWLKNAMSAPITNNSAIYINGEKDRLGTGIGINSDSLGDSYGLTILGDLEDWKQLGYYCFKYKFTYSPLDKNSIDKITYGVSSVTSWKVNTFVDDYGYTYYSDTIDLSVKNYVDYNNDGIDDVTGEDLSNLNDNSSSVGLDKNASIAETMEYYINKFYDAIKGLIKTPFTMLESALKLGDTYLVKLTNLLSPVTNNFKQLLSFVPDDIMTCVWGIIVCRLTWTSVRSFISMLTKR